jgi:hypothetical protein
MGFNMVHGCKTRNKIIKIVAIGVLNTEVVHDQTKGDGAGGVAKKAWGRGLNETERQEKSDKLQVGQLTCFFETVESLVGAKENILLAVPICLDERVETEARQDCGRIRGNINFEELWVRGGST